MRMIITNNSINERGGAERVILKIAQKYDAKIYTNKYDRTSAFPEFANIDVEIIGKGSGRSLLPKKAANAVRWGVTFYNKKITEDYDLINAHMSPSEWIRNKNERVLWYCHTPPRIVYDKSVAGIKKRSLRNKIAYAPLSLVYKRVERRMVSKMEGIAVNSVNTQGKLKEYLGAASTVINPGVDCKEFSDKGDDKFFLYPSRIAEEKRQDYAIHAFNRFTELRGKRDYKLVIAGSLSSRYDEFGKYFDRLKDMSSKNVVFRTNPDDGDMKDLYSRCTVVLYPPINEDFGIVPLEAMASKKPVIAVDEGGPKETIVNGKTGFLVDSIEGMAERMLYLVKHERAAIAMGKSGRSRVEKFYSWNAFFKKFDRIAKRVAKA